MLKSVASVACEGLERRLLFSTVTWTSGASGSWDVGSNWSGGAVPGSGDTVIINQPGVTVTINNNDSANSLNCADNLTIAGGSLTISTNSEIDGSFSIDGNIGLGGATLKITGATEWDSATVSGGTLQNTGTLTLGSSNDKSLSNATLDNRGAVDQTLGRLLLSNGTVTNESGATYNFQTDNGIFNNGYTNAFNNSGTLEKSAGTGNSAMSVPFYNAAGAQVTVQTGTISISAGGTNSGGVFNVAAGAILDLTGGSTTTITGTYTGSGAGIVQVGTGTLGISTAATFDFPSGLFQWNNGTISGGTLNNTGVITLSSTNDKSLSGATLDNTGTVIQTMGRLLLSASTVTNESGGVYDFQNAADASITNNGYTNLFNNLGTLSKSTGGGNLLMQVPFNNNANGVISAQAASVILSAGGSSAGGTFVLANGATVDLTGGTTNNLSGTYTASGQGQVQLNNGTLNTGSSGATFNFPAGLFQWTGGTITGSGGLLNNNVITLSGTNDKSLSATTLTNAGTIAQVLGRLLLSASAVTNNPGALYDFQTDNGIFNNGYTNAFNNNGTLRKSAGTGTSAMSVPFYNITGAQVVVQTGTISLTAGGDSTGGTFNVAAGAVFDLTGGNNYTLTGTYGGSGAGNVELNNGTLNVSGAVTFDFSGSYFQWTGGIIAGGTLTNAATITLNSTNDKTLDSATLENRGTIVQSLGRLLLSASTVNNDSGGLYDFQTDNGIFNNGYTNAFNNTGTLRKSFGTGTSTMGVPFYNVPNAQIVDESGTISLAGGGSSTGGTFTLSTNAVLDLTGGNSNTFSGTYGGSGSGTVQLSSGTLNVNTTTTFDLPGNLFQWTGGTISGGTFIDAGNLTLSGTNDKNLTSATLEVSGTAIQLLGRLLLGSASLTIDASGLYDFQTDNGIFNNGYTNVVTNNGTLRKSIGTGTSQINMAVTNSGVIEADTGTLNLSGGLTENSSGTITARIFNQGSGQVSINGAVALAGKLNITLPTGFVPVQGNTYHVVTYGSQTGAFSSINGLTAPSVVFSANVGTTAATITVGTGAPQPQVDLTVGNVNYSAATYQPGSTISVTGTEANSGPGAAGQYDVAVVLSPDQVYGNANDIVLQTVNESGLGSNAQKQFSASATIPASAPAGSYYVLVQIDSGQVINETSYGNELFISSSPDVVIAAPPPSPPPASPPPASPPSPPSAIGGLDPTFGTDGLASHNVGFTSTAGVAVQSDGQSVIAGTTGAVGSEDFGLTRYNADGSLDTTFGANGVATVNFGGDDQAAAVAVLPDGDILVAGTDTTYSNGQPAGSQFALAEFTSAGVLDTSFGNGTGKVLTRFSATAGTLSNDVAHAMIVASNGTIYLGGSSDAAGSTGQDFAVAAYNADGSPDTRFGGGAVLKDFSGQDDVIYGLAIQNNGDVVAAGSTTNPTSGVSSVALSRFLPTGAIDKTFGSKGQVVTNVRGVADVASSVAIDKTGKIVVGGLSATGSASDGSLSSDFLVIRYTAGGAIDRTFGKGPVITGFGQPAAVTQVVIQPDGKIVASGKSVASLSGLDTSQLEVAVARYNTNGALDPTFDSTGMALFDLAGASASPAASGAILHATSPPAALAFDLEAFTSDSLTFSPDDTGSTLLAEFQQFEQSAQGVVAVTQGGELLDVGNSGVNTVEAAIVASGIDLAAQLLATLPPAVVGGAKGMATVKVTETGTDPATGTITIQLFASPDPTIDSGLTPFQSFSERINLKANQGATFRLRYAFPTSLADGNYYLVTNVDTGSVRDLSTENNVAASGSTVDIAAPFIDLTGSGLAAVGALKAGKSATVTYNVVNDGNVPAKGNIAVELLASIDGMVSDGTVLGTPKLALNLNPGVTRKIRQSIRLPSNLAAASYYLVAVLDSTNVLNDSNVANNVLVSSSAVAVT